MLVSSCFDNKELTLDLRKISHIVASICARKGWVMKCRATPSAMQLSMSAISSFAGQSLQIPVKRPGQFGQRCLFNTPRSVKPVSGQLCSPTRQVSYKPPAPVITNILTMSRSDRSVNGYAHFRRRRQSGAVVCHISEWCRDQDQSTNISQLIGLIRQTSRSNI